MKQGQEGFRMGIKKKNPILTKAEIAGQWIAVGPPLLQAVIGMIIGTGLGVQSLWIALSSLPAIPYIWWTKQKSALLPKILTTGILLLRALLWFLPSFRIQLLLHICIFGGLLILIICYLLFAPKKGGVNGIIWIVFLVSTGFVILMEGMRCSCVSGDIFPRWQILLGISLAIALFVWIYCLTKGHRFWGAVGYFLLTAIVSWALLGFCSAAVNYAFDFSEPQAIDIVIEDHDVTLHRKGADAHKLLFTVDGKKHWVHVPYREYWSYEIGDTYRIYRYQGALGEPFFIASGYAE